MRRAVFGRFLYGTLFVFVLPAALILWARAAAVGLPAVQSIPLGKSLVTAGVLAMAAGMIALWRHGGGLPMNAFPPPRFVESGIYALAPHPIYGGFVIVCAGVSVYWGSASGLWLVTPTVALACAALVLGYELPDLQRRFGRVEFSVWLPRDQSGRPSLLERLRVYVTVLLPWLAGFELIGAMGQPKGAVGTYFPFESRIPIIEQTEVLYASTYVVVLLAPLMIGSGRGLRRFAKLGLRAMALVFPFYVVVPFFVPPRPFEPSMRMGQLLLMERSPSSGNGAFPSFHVIWALIAACALSEAKGWKRILWFCWAALVALSCITTGMHSILDVIAGAIAFVAVLRMRAIWEWMLHCAEAIANGWKEWRIGPLRIINHGGFAALAALTGVILIDALLGPGRTPVTLSIFLCSTVGAALWAQWIEGSPALLRPMGFYGGMIGAGVGSLMALAAGLNLLVPFAAVCIAAPWIQALGRLRCLVQGCCHGRPIDGSEGICYTHPRTRVCRLTEFGGMPIHATQVYSIVCNVVTGAALMRLYFAEASCTMICGIYLILSGVGRFVEEAYRGEPQTKSFFGLHLYQWISIFCVVAGAVTTALPSSPFAPMDFRWSSLALGLACGATAWFVTGMDFPESSRRFARLT